MKNQNVKMWGCLADPGNSMPLDKQNQPTLSVLSLPREVELLAEVNGRINISLCHVNLESVLLPASEPYRLRWTDYSMEAVGTHIQ